MKIIQLAINHIEYFQTTDGGSIVNFMARAARVCYKSEERATPSRNRALIEHLLSRGHHAMTEFWSIAVHLTVDRGVTHELVRHRVASFAQESTRYCDYNGDKLNGEITVVEPPGMNDEQAYLWAQSMECAERAYKTMRDAHAPAEIARGVLPTSLKAEIWIMANVREWRHIFALRTAKTAHPLMRYIMRKVAEQFAKNIPILFDDYCDVDSTVDCSFCLTAGASPSDESLHATDSALLNKAVYTGLQSSLDGGYDPNEDHKTFAERCDQCAYRFTCPNSRRCRETCKHENGWHFVQSMSVNNE